LLFIFRITWATLGKKKKNSLKKLIALPVVPDCPWSPTCPLGPVAPSKPLPPAGPDCPLAPAGPGAPTFPL